MPEIISFYSECNLSNVSLTGVVGDMIVSDYAFFKPFNSTYDAGARGLSILIAPLIYGFHTFSALFSVLKGLLEAAFHILIGDFSESISLLKDTASSLTSTFIFLVATIVSPIINCIDFVGSIITTLMPASKPNQADIVENVAALV